MLNQQDYAERHVRAALNERDELLRRRFVVRRLAEPIQQGWVRKYVLTEYAERRRDADTLAAIAATIGPVRFCQRPDFRARRCRSRRLFDVEQPLERLFDRRFERLGSPASWRPHFRWVHYQEWGRPRFFGEFRHPALFEFRVEPRLVWIVYDLDPEIETRLEELHRWLTIDIRLRRHEGRAKAWWDWEDPRVTALEREHRRRIRQAMQDPSEADPAMPVGRGPIRFGRPIFSACVAQPAEAPSSNLDQCECKSRRRHYLLYGT